MFSGSTGPSIRSAATVCVLAVTGCFGPAASQTAVLSALTGAEEHAVNGSGNIVVSYTNRTDASAHWTLVWQGPSDGSPTVLTTSTEPGGSGTATLEAAVSQLSLGGLTTPSVGVLVGPQDASAIEVAYPGPVLEAGVDFHDGDIVTFILTEVSQGEFAIGVEITPGG